MLHFSPDCVLLFTEFPRVLDISLTQLSDLHALLSWTVPLALSYVSLSAALFSEVPAYSPLPWTDLLALLHLSLGLPLLGQ